MEHKQFMKVCTYFRENDEDNLDLRMPHSLHEDYW